MTRYDKLFLLPSDIIPLEEDGLRQTQWGSRLLFDAALLGLLKIWGYSYEVLESESLEERIAEVKRRLDLC
jgi:nicotinamide riboside kinase